MSWEVAASLPVVATTAYRGLALLGLGEGDDTNGKVLVITGASGGVGVVATQLAVARGVTVIGSAGERHLDDVAALGATPVRYGEGFADRVREVTDHVDAAFDTAGKGDLGALVALTGSADRVLTIADTRVPRSTACGSPAGGDGEVAGRPRRLRRRGSRTAATARPRSSSTRSRKQGRRRRTTAPAR